MVCSGESHLSHHSGVMCGGDGWQAVRDEAKLEQIGSVRYKLAKYESSLFLFLSGDNTAIRVTHTWGYFPSGAFGAPINTLLFSDSTCSYFKEGNKI